MAYKQKQGRKSFKKTGEGITSALTGVGNPPEVKMTDDGIRTRMKDISLKLRQGVMKTTEAKKSLHNLYHISKGNQTNYNYAEFRKDSINSASRAQNYVPGWGGGNSRQRKLGWKVHEMANKNTLPKYRDLPKHP